MLIIYSKNQDTCMGIEETNLLILIVIIALQTTLKLHLKHCVKHRKQTKLDLGSFKEANVNDRLDGMGHTKFCNPLNCVETN